MAVIDKVRYIKVDFTKNCNRWWEMELHDNDDVFTRWARVGNQTQQASFLGGGRKKWDAAIKDKLRKGYTKAQVVIGDAPITAPASGDLHSIAKSQLLKSSNPVLESLIQRFVKANVHKITENTQITYNSDTGLFSTPLGIVTLEGISDARVLLANIATQLKRKNSPQLPVLVGEYLRIIPQKVGRKMSIQDLFDNDSDIQKQADLLDSLESSYQSLSTVPVTQDKKDTPTIFKVGLDVLNDGKERKRIEDFYENSKKSMHSYDRIKVREIFAVTIEEMHKAFAKDLKPIKEVFHGTSQANCLSILKSGLKVSPPSTAAIAGKAFGNGIYGAINSTKSLGYTFGRWGQGGVGESGWLFICDFAMGKIQDAKNSYSLQKGYDSMWAKAGDRFYNDELIVYKNNQVNIKYLLECK